MRAPKSPATPSSESALAHGGVLVRRLLSLAVTEGKTWLSLPGVHVVRASMRYPYRPTVYAPSIMIVAQGEKKAYLEQEKFLYDPRNYLVLSVPLPFVVRAIGTTRKPMLGMSIPVNPITVAELSSELDGTGVLESGAASAIGTAPMTEKIWNAAERLADSLTKPADARILGPAIIREIIYHALCGQSGEILRALVHPRSGFRKIADTLRCMNHDFARPLKVKVLAHEAGMSLSAFHTAFKDVTGYSPQRYLQCIRLQKAKALITTGDSVAEAAYKVGYQSPSQFSREYKRLFGFTPSETAGHDYN